LVPEPFDVALKFELMNDEYETETEDIRVQEACFLISLQGDDTPIKSLDGSDFYYAR
jgi:hypothetical protein